MKNQIKLGVIGVGRFGINYLKTLKESNDASVKWICSSTEDTLKKVIDELNITDAIETTDYKEILKDKDVDAVIIATPASTHYRITKDSILSGKHALVEKPMCLNSKDAEDLLKISKNKKRILMAGHLHLFNPGIQKIKHAIKQGLFGKINYIGISHFGNGPIRSDMSALWDFFPHSISILLYLLEKNPVEISVNGASFIRKGIEDIAAMNLKFPDNIFATSSCSWLYPLKKFEIVVAGEKLYAVFDDYAKNAKLKYYNSRPKLINGKIIIEDKGHQAIDIEDAKPLAQQLSYFLACINQNKIEINDAENALKITKIIEFGQDSLRKSKSVRIRL